MRLNPEAKQAAEQLRPKNVSKHKFIHFQSLETTDINSKMGIAFVLMSLVPLLLMLYMVYFHTSGNISPDQTKVNLKLLVFLSVLASLIGFWIIRKISSSLGKIVKTAREMVEEGAFGKEIRVSEHSEEVESLVKVFNRITKDLENKVHKLEHSKQLIQDLLKKIGSVVTSGESIENFLELVIETMVDALEAESGVLLILERDGKQFRSTVACGKHRETLLRLAARPEGTFGWVIHQKQSMVINQADLGGENQIKNELSYSSLVCVPLRYQNETLGYMAMINKTNNDSFTKDDELLLEHVANQIATAVKNNRLNEDAGRVYVETISALAMAIGKKDPYTRGHLERVSNYAVRIAEAIDLNEQEILTLKDAAFLHDIGKIAIDDRILQKREKLTHEEMEEMKTHTEIGEKIIAPLSSFKNLRDIVRHHQEWYDGSGYPDGLKGEDIPVGARILCVADVYDALTTDRPNRKAFSHDLVIKMIEEESGTHFDPAIVKVFLKIIDKVRV